MPGKSTRISPKYPLTGLVPVIHVLKRHNHGKEDVDARHKAGHGTRGAGEAFILNRFAEPGSCGNNLANPANRPAGVIEAPPGCS